MFSSHSNWFPYCEPAELSECLTLILDGQLLYNGLQLIKSLIKLFFLCKNIVSVKDFLIVLHNKTLKYNSYKAQTDAFQSISHLSDQFSACTCTTITHTHTHTTWNSISNNFHHSNSRFFIVSNRWWWPSGLQACTAPGVMQDSCVCLHAYMCTCETSESILRFMPPLVVYSLFPSRRLTSSRLQHGMMPAFGAYAHTHTRYRQCSITISCVWTVMLIQRVLGVERQPVENNSCECQK